MADITCECGEVMDQSDACKHASVCRATPMPGAAAPSANAVWAAKVIRSNGWCGHITVDGEPPREVGCILPAGHDDGVHDKAADSSSADSDVKCSRCGHPAHERVARLVKECAAAWDAAAKAREVAVFNCANAILGLPNGATCGDALKAVRALQFTSATGEKKTVTEHTCPQSDPGPEDVTPESECKACHPPEALPEPVPCGPYRTAALPPKAAPVCTTCNDTHQMPSRPEWACTSCPTPCEKCRSRGPGQAGGPFCAKTPCDCACHEKTHHYKSWRKRCQPMTTPK